MKLIIEARLEGDGIETAKDPIPIAVIDRHDDDLEQLGLSLAEGRELLAATQSVLVSRQVCAWVVGEDYCHHCYTPLRRKDTRFIVMRTVFGKVTMKRRARKTVGGVTPPWVVLHTIVSARWIAAPA